MRFHLALTALLATTPAFAEAPAPTACRPAAKEVVAEADRKAADASRKADKAESESVRSGNPGAARRAEVARHEADEAIRAADELACRLHTTVPSTRKPNPGY